MPPTKTTAKRTVAKNQTLRKQPAKKQTAGLAAFTQRQAPADPAREALTRTKARGATVAMTFRLSHDEWDRVHQLVLQRRFR